MKPVIRDFDPLRLSDQTTPTDVGGVRPPAICLVDEEGPFPAQHALGFRVAAALIAALFAGSTVAMAFATSGKSSPITDAGDWRQLEGAVTSP